MSGFIALEDGRAFAVASWVTDATLRAIAQEVDDRPLRKWLLAQQSEFVGMGMTYVDLREIAPQHRPVMHTAIRHAYEHARQSGVGWLDLFGDLVEMLDHCAAGDPPEDFNPHMQEVIPARGRRVGPGWDD